MSTSVPVDPAPAPVLERRYSGVGRCKFSFWFAVSHDVLGVSIMLVGAFGGLLIHDLFIYAGAIVIFLSLIWWVFWYSGNIDVPPEELQDDVGMIKLRSRTPLGRAVRRVSDRIRDSFRKSRNGPNVKEPNVKEPAGNEVSLSTTSSPPDRDFLSV